MKDSMAPATPGPDRDSGGGRWSVDTGRSGERFSAGVAVGFVFGGLLFLLGAVIFVAASRGTSGSPLGDDLQSELVALRKELAAVAAGPDAVPGQVEALRSQLTKLSEQITSLERTLTAGEPGRMAKLEKALRESELARRAGEEALLQKGMRGPLMVFQDAARRARQGDAPMDFKVRPEPGPRPHRPPAAPKKVDRDF